jgi:L,D-transpeptidase-like protein
VTTVQLIHWRQIARWANAIRPARVHATPSLHGRPIAQLHFETEDGFPEVYLVLARRGAKHGKTWLKVAVPMRPNGTTGWVLRGGLGPIRTVRTWLVIDRTRLRAQFFDRGRPVWSAPVGIGAPATPTPDGLFWVREQFVLPDQVFYGPYAFGTSAYASITDWPGGGVVGLHGTSLPQLIPGRPSHGCIRLRNEDILWLAYHMQNGTPVAIVN